MQARTIAVGLVVALLLPRSYAAQREWLRVSTPNFELYTDESASRARETILYFEQVRAFFAEATQARRAPAKAVRIIGFRSEKEFSTYSVRAGIRAYYQPGSLREYIVLMGLGSELHEAAVHEYVHLMIHAAGAPPPLWLDEGLAQLYASLRSVGNSASIGAVPPAQLDYLSTGGLLDLGTLVEVDHESPLYADAKRLRLFYAESWALTHMLALGDDYRSGFPAFLGAIADGLNTAEALEKSYARSVAQVQRDLRGYLQQAAYKVFTFRFGLAKQAGAVEIQVATPLESGLVLAELLAGRRGSELEARQAYEKLALDYPRSWEPEAGLAYLALRSRSMQEAERRFARAAELGSDDPKLYFDYAMSAAVGDGSARADLLRKAVGLRPDYEEANLYLGFALYQVGDFRGARDALIRVKRVTREQAVQYFQILALCNDRLDMLEEAKAAAKSAADSARSERETNSVRNLQEYLERPRGFQDSVRREPLQRTEAPPLLSRRAPAVESSELNRTATEVLARSPGLSSAEGSLVQVDCLGDSARLWLASGSEKLAFIILDPKGIVIRRNGTSIVHDFSCGPQKPQPVTLQYELSSDPKLGARGVIRILEFR